MHLFVLHELRACSVYVVFTFVMHVLYSSSVYTCYVQAISLTMLYMLLQV